MNALQVLTNKKRKRAYDSLKKAQENVSTADFDLIQNAVTEWNENANIH